MYNYLITIYTITTSSQVVTDARHLWLPICHSAVLANVISRFLDNIKQKFTPSSVVTSQIITKVSILYQVLKFEITRKQWRFIVKCKAVPLQAWTSPEGSRKLRFPDFVKTAQDGGKVVSLTHRPLFTPRKYSWYSFLLEAESTPGPQCDRMDFMSMKNSNDISWDRTSDVPICSTAP